MKKILLIALLIAGSCAALAQEPLVEHQSVTAYLQSLTEEPVFTINQKVDQLIDSIGQQYPQLQSKVAGMAFDYFTSTHIMGHEAVAVHIADNWFLNGKLKLEDENLYPMLYTFAEFNRSSLVGADAPGLEMEDIDGIRVEIREDPGSSKVLFFYDTECSTCRREAPMLAELAQNYTGEPLTIFAIYTQSDREAWKKYVEETFSSIDNPKVNMVHLWDPEAATGFHKKYAVLSTPMMFLLDSQNIILGRGLDCESLAQLLFIENTQALRYKQMFENVFGQFKPLTFQNVQGLIDAFHEKVAPNRKLHAELFINLFNYLRTSNEFPKQQGALYLAEKYIASEPDQWAPEFLDRTIHALAQAKLNPVGYPATNLTLQNKRGRDVQMIDYKHYYTLVFFHLIDCQQCQKEIEALKKLKPELFDIDIQVVMVYVGSEQEKWKKFVKEDCLSRWKYYNDFKGKSNMRQLYDLEYVPHMYLLDADGIVTAKDINTQELKELLPYL